MNDPDLSPLALGFGVGVAVAVDVGVGELPPAGGEPEGVAVVVGVGVGLDDATPGGVMVAIDAAGGVRTWSDSEYTPSISGWPAVTSSTFQTFDPLWSLQTGTVFTDPAAGAWFPQQALQLAENANPALTFP